jgi:hypothetical protein
MTYILYIKTETSNGFRVFTEGDDKHIDHWIKYITRKYPHASYKVQVVRPDGGEK